MDYNTLKEKQIHESIVIFFKCVWDKERESLLHRRTTTYNYRKNIRTKYSHILREEISCNYVLITMKKCDGYYCSQVIKYKITNNGTN